MLFVPEQGSLRFWTELGIIDAEPGELSDEQQDAPGLFQGR